MLTPTPLHAPKVSAGGNRTVFAQVATEFSAELSGVVSEAKPFASYRWNFGNGEEVLTRAVLYRYVRPGSYVVSVSVSSGGVTVSDRIVVTVIPTAVSILEVGVDGIELYNGASKDIDLTDWKLKVGASIFVFPKDTVLLAGKTLFFESRITSLTTDSDTQVDVLYPTGHIAASTKKNDPGEPLEVVTQKDVEVRDEPSIASKRSKKSEREVEEVATVARHNEEVVEENAIHMTSSATQQRAVAHEGMDGAGGIYWYPVIALVALIGVASSAIFLMKSPKPTTSEVESDINSPAVLNNDMELSGTDVLGKFTVVAKPIQGSGVGGKTNEADSYTIVE
jgi:PKD repeat protein